MKNRILLLTSPAYLICMGLALLLMSSGCNQAKKPQPGLSTPVEEQVSTSSTPNTAESTPKGKQVITAKFVDFVLGDAEHYSFEEKDGKTWDFGGCDAKNYEFGLELPAGEADDTNQGYTSNKKLQGKWFKITFEYRNQPLYLDGPMGDVPVIVAVEMAK